MTPVLDKLKKELSEKKPSGGGAAVKAENLMG